MSQPSYDITLLTDARYVHPKPGDWYVENILLEDQILRTALEARGLKVHRTHWDNPDFDWRQTRSAMFRTTWDYFDRFAEFTRWLADVSSKTQLINDLQLVRWNMDKAYLGDLARVGIPIPPTQFIAQGDLRSLREIAQAAAWDEFVLKPAVSGAARHTYRCTLQAVATHEEIFRQLISAEDMLVQEFLHNVPLLGELTLMVMDGHYTHAVHKKARAGDFRVQDDFGGTVADYVPTVDEIAFAERVIQACPTHPLYARVDMVWDNAGQLCVSELEAIEPELWFRKHPAAVAPLADGIARLLQQH